MSTPTPSANNENEEFKFDANKNFYKEPPVPINWNEKDEEKLKRQVLSNIENVYGPNKKESPTYNPAMPSCEKPNPITSDKIFDKASDLANQLGANQECVKDTKNKMAQDGRSKAFDERSAANSDFTTSVGGASGSSSSGSSGSSESESEKTRLEASYAASGSVGWGAASASVSAKMAAERAEERAKSQSESHAASQSKSDYDARTGSSGTNVSSTGSEQATSAMQEASSLQKGCGSIMITATNMVQKNMAMQCVLNSIASEGDMTVGMTASIIVETLPLTDKEMQSKAKLEDKLAEIVLKNSIIVERLSTILLNQPQPTAPPAQTPPPSMTSPEDLNIFYKQQQKNTEDFYERQQKTFVAKIEGVTSFYTKQEEGLKKAITDGYNRSIDMKSTQLINRTVAKVKYVQSITTSAKSDLATLAASAQKDVVAAKMANDLGVSAQDPNIKSMAQRACENTSSTSSSNMTNLLNKMKMSVSAGNTIKIIAAGRIHLENVVLNNEIALDLCIQSIMNQATDSGMSSATQALSDTSNATEVANKVAGLESTQKAMGDANVAAITAANAPILGSQAAATEAQKAFAERSKAQTEMTKEIAKASFDAGSIGATAGLGATTTGLVGATAGLAAVGKAKVSDSLGALNAADDVVKMQAASGMGIVGGVIGVAILLFILYKFGIIGGGSNKQ